MNRVAMDYARLCGGVMRGAEALTRDLAAGDPDSFKAGYSIPSAVLAAAEAFGLAEDERAELACRVERRVGDGRGTTMPSEPGRRLTDERARLLLRLLDDYREDALAEGETSDDVAAMTFEELVGDLEQTT